LRRGDTGLWLYAMLPNLISLGQWWSIIVTFSWPKFSSLPEISVDSILCRWIIVAAVSVSLLSACGAHSPGALGVSITPQGNNVGLITPTFEATLVGNSTNALQGAGLENTGAVTVTLTSATLSGPDAQYFTPSNNTCLNNAALASLTSCTMTLTFTPTAARAYSATLTFVDSAVGSPHIAPITAIATATAPIVDCSLSTNLCTALNIQADPIAAGLFHGYADPTLRADNASPNIYLAYSWPHTLSDGTHVIDIHLAQATTSQGAVSAYNYVGPLYQSSVSTQTVTNTYASTNDTSAETIDLLPLSTTTVTNGQPVTTETWVQAHVSYLVKPQSDIYAQLIPTSVISISALNLSSPGAANAGTALLGLATAPEARLGAAGTDASRNVTQNLASLSSSSKNCVSFSHPALWYSSFGSGTLYLALECVEASGNTDIHQYSHFLYSTTPTGSDASMWSWSFVSEFATPAEAVQLATAEGATYTFFTGLKFAQSIDAPALNERLLMIVSPAALAPNGAVQPIVQYGCRALLSGSLAKTGTFLLNSPATSSFLVDTNGAPLDSGKITETDLYTGANEGPGSCTFSSTMGLITNRKYEADPTQGFYTYPVSTGLIPNRF
jgi:hypothetical protein